MGESSENEGKRVRVGGGWRKGSDWEVNTRGRWLHHEGGHRRRRIDEDGLQPTAPHSLNGAAVSTTPSYKHRLRFFFFTVLLLLLLYFTE